jgi:ribosome-associated translation inhibitor RaiA
MQITTTFRDMAPSPALDAAAHRWFARLAHVAPRITACHVTIERSHKNQLHGAPFQVSVVVTVPGARIAVTHQKDLDAHVALADAFRTARRQLLEHTDLQRGFSPTPLAAALRAIGAAKPA